MPTQHVRHLQAEQAVQNRKEPPASSCVVLFQSPELLRCCSSGTATKHPQPRPLRFINDPLVTSGVGPSVPDGLLRTLVALFADLRLALEDGRLQLLGTGD